MYVMNVILMMKIISIISIIMMMIMMVVMVYRVSTIYLFQPTIILDNFRLESGLVTSNTIDFNLNIRINHFAL